MEYFAETRHNITRPDLSRMKCTYITLKCAAHYIKIYEHIYTVIRCVRAHVICTTYSDRLYKSSLDADNRDHILQIAAFNEKTVRICKLSFSFIEYILQYIIFVIYLFVSRSRLCEKITCAPVYTKFFFLDFSKKKGFAIMATRAYPPLFQRDFIQEYRSGLFSRIVNRSTWHRPSSIP